MSAQGSGRSLFASLQVLLGSGLDLVRNRLELLVVELEEEKFRLLSLLGYGAAALLLLSAGLVFLAIFLTVLFWDGYRLLALGAFAAIFLIAGAVALYVAWSQGRTQGRLFSASLAELAKDSSAVGGDEFEEQR